MLKLPDSVLISWPLPSEHPTRRGPEMWIVSAIFLFITTICVSLRLWTRIFIRRWVGLDDVFIVIAFIFSVSVTALAAVGTHKFDWDEHVWEIAYNHVTPSLKVLYAARICWGVASSLVRLSVLCLYYRLAESCTAPRSFFRVLHVTTLINVGLLLYYFFSGLMPCFPLKAYWTYPGIPGAHCLDDGLSMEIAAVVNTIWEIWIATMPLIAVFKLRVKQSQRWSVIGVLCLGYFVGLTGIFRTVYVFKAFTTYDFTWWSMPQWICSEVEIDLALICACVAPMRPLASKFRSRSGPKKVRSRQHSKQSDSTNQMIEGRKASVLSGDCEALQEWNTAITHHVDLEGISTEGYGYTVTISGPGPAPKARRRMPKLRSFNEEESIFQKPRRRRSSSRLRPVKTTEVSVRESFEAPGRPGRTNFWQKLDGNSENVNPQNMTFLTGFDCFDEKQVTPPRSLSRSISREMYYEASPFQAIDNNTQALPQVLTPLTSHTHEFLELDNNIEALPQLPRPSHQESSRTRTGPRTSSIRRTFHGQTWSKGSKD